MSKGKYITIKGKTVYQQSEEELQRAVVKYCRLRSIEIIPSFTCVKIGGLTLGMKMKAAGMEKGVPDLFFPSLKLFIELKVGKNKPSVEQLAFMKRREKDGYRTAICYTFEEVKSKLEVAHD